jgi:phage shock protein PspC (stress-responsive transcriptional regulator)
VPDELPAPAAATVRVRQGRWLAGVCAGLARRLAVSPRRVRLAFVLLTFVGLLGPLAYLAFLLILPEEGHEEQTVGPRTIVSLAQLVGAALGLALLVALATAAQLFGYGWVAVGGAVVAVLWVAARWRRSGPAWAVLPVAALTLPASAVALAGLSMTPDTSTSVLRPRTLAALQAHGIPHGFTRTEIDLRATDLPASGTVRLDLTTGLGDTVVALPHDRCVRVVVDRRAPARAWRRTLAVLGSRVDREPVDLFGVWRSGFVASRHVPAGSHGLTLRIRFASVRGGLTVRDYPASVNPLDDPDWPLGSGLSDLSDTQIRDLQHRYPDTYNLPPGWARLRGGPCARGNA